MNFSIFTTCPIYRSIFCLFQKKLNALDYAAKLFADIDQILLAVLFFKQGSEQWLSSCFSLYARHKAFSFANAGSMFRF